MKNYIIGLLINFILVAGLAFGCNQKETKEEGVYYTCSMHPEIKKDALGPCPICGMDLVKKEK